MAAGLGKNLNAFVDSIKQTVKKSSESAVNIGICIFTAGSEQLFSFAVFNCPCPTPILKHNSLGEEKDHLSTGMVYGTVFIAVPALILFLIGCAMNIKMWKLTTGYCHREKTIGPYAYCMTLLEITMQAMVAPCTWISIAFLDGKYYACASSANPYNMTCKQVVEHSFKNLEYTIEYEGNKHISQVIGWIFITICLFLGTTIYMIYRCNSKQSYHKRHFMKWYQEFENKKIEEKAKKMLETRAETNINNFLSKQHGKNQWDFISEVFTTREKQQCGCYSRLDNWSKEHSPKGDRQQNHDGNNSEASLLSEEEDQV